MDAKLQIHSEAKLQNTKNVQLDLENSTHEENEEFPNGDTYDNLDVERNNMETRKEPILAKYVRRHHPADQIIGDKEVRPMTRNILRSETCLLRKM